MGCFWSSEGREHCTHCNRKAVNNLVIIDHVCEICIDRAVALPRSRTPPARTHYSPPGPKFGEYRCSSCKRYWNSRWCWPDKYQMCQTCKKPSLPYKYRDLTPTDLTSSGDNVKEHVKELCQMCQQLGYPCKDFDKKYKPTFSAKSRTMVCTKSYSRKL